MRKAKSLFVGVVALGALLFGATVVHAGRVLNAHVNVEKAKLGLGWAVTDDVATPNKYAAVITVTVPQRTHIAVRKKAPNETVVIKHSADLHCGPTGIEVNVSYLVSPLKGATGKQVAVTIAKVAGQKPAATGDVLGEGTGKVGQDISVHFAIPGACR